MYSLSKLRTAFDAVIDSVMPPKERTRRARALTLEELPLNPTVHEMLGLRITTLMDYRVDAVRDLVQSLKYDGAGVAAELTAKLLAEFLHEELAAERSFSQRRILLVPLPLHTSREYERGFNQIARALSYLPAELRDGTRATLAENVLERTRATLPQTHFSRAERLSNVAGAFGCPKPNIVQNTHVFLIDDVATTGATLVNAATPLRRAGATVSLVALARA